MVKPYEVEIKGDDESKRAFKSAKRSIDGIERALGKAGKAGSQTSSIFKGMTISRVAVDMAYRMLDAIKQTVRAGFEYNRTIEQSILGIGSIVASSTNLVNAEGKLLKGREALNAALKLSADLVRQIEIRGLQTTATTQELVQAFQNAVGPATAFGLSLKETRDITLDIVQAAGALGVPMNQLNEEVRSIVSGTIRMDSRVAKALGLTNAMVKSWAEQNTLAAELTKKLKIFRLAGDETAKTWTGLTSNMEEAISKISGTLTRDIFDELKVSMAGVLEGLIQVNDEGVTIAPELMELKSIVNDIWSAFKDVIGIVGELIALKDFASLLKTSAGFVAKIAEGWREIARLVGKVTKPALQGIVRGWAHIIGLIKQGPAYLDTIDDKGKAIKTSTEAVAASTENLIKVYGTLSAQKVEAYRKAYRKTLNFLEREVDAVKKLEQKKVDLLKKTNSIKRQLHDDELSRQRQVQDFDLEEKRLKRELRVLKGYKQPLTEQEQKKKKIKDTERELKRLQEDRGKAEEDYALKVKESMEELQKLDQQGKLIAEKFAQSKSNVQLLNEALAQSSAGTLKFNANLAKSVTTSNQLATNLIAAGKAITEYNQKLPQELKDEKMFRFAELEKELQAPMTAAAESANKTETAVKNINREGSVQVKQLQANKTEWERINDLADEHEAKLRRIQLAMRDWNFQMEGVTDQAGAYSPGY